MDEFSISLLWEAGGDLVFDSLKEEGRSLYIYIMGKYKHTKHLHIILSIIEIEPSSIASQLSNEGEEKSSCFKG